MIFTRELIGKRVAVFGATSVVGMVLSVRLAREGAVVYAFARSVEQLKTLRLYHGGISVCCADALEVRQRERDFLFSDIDALIFCGDYSVPQVGVGVMRTNMLKQEVDTHAVAFHEAYQALAPIIIEGGDVVAVSPRIIRSLDPHISEASLLNERESFTVEAIQDAIVLNIGDYESAKTRKLRIHKIAPAAVTTPHYAPEPPTFSLETVVRGVIDALTGDHVIANLIVRGTPTAVSVAASAAS